MNILQDPVFHDEDAAYQHVESILWPDGPICPKCGSLDNAYRMKGKRARPGLRRCRDCKKDFTVKIGTIFEDSHVKMHQWMQAMYLMCASKKGFSAHQLHRTLGVTYKTAWFMEHRIREAMRSGNLRAPLGGEGKKVEADETFIGRKKGTKIRRGTAHKMAVLSLVERGGEVRSFPINTTKAKEIGPIVNKHIAKESDLMTDEASQYQSNRQAIRVSRLGYAQRWPVR